jgi:hypothetical protein
MELGLSLDTGLSLRQEHRLELEERLEQVAELRAEQGLHLTLAQYLTKEDYVRELIDWVEEHKRWKKFEKWGFNFSYGLVPYERVKNVADEWGYGFSHCFYDSWEAMFCGEKVALAKGDWTLFVVERPDVVPKSQEKIIALHERGEQLSLGDHFFASKLEFAGVKRDIMVREYIRWMDKHYPQHFVDLTEPCLEATLPDELRDELEQQGWKDNEELKIAERMIEDYPMPTDALKLSLKYDETNEKVGKELAKVLGPCQAVIHSSILDKPKSPEEDAASINQILHKAIMSIPQEEIRVLVPRRTGIYLEPMLNTLKGDFAKAHNHYLDISYNVSDWYESARKEEPIAKIEGISRTTMFL